ncbi:MAG: homogentisate 1,2-dioxygenase [Acidimicrobiales bacterium]
MPYYRHLGQIPRKRHTLHPLPEGVAHEELLGEEGFSSSSSLLYHRHSPSALRSIEPIELEDPLYVPNVPVTPHHLRTPHIGREGAVDPVVGRNYLLGNHDVQIAWVRATGDSPLYRNARGDELVFVRTGAATLESVFGAIDVATGDYLVIPAGTTHRWLVAGECEALIVEASGHLEIPGRYLTPTGQLKEGAPFSERDLRAPSEPLLVDGHDVAVLVKTRSGLSRHVHVHHPFDVIGWDGCLYPWALSVFDFEPLVGRIHQPPPVHQTLAGSNFVVCSFVPRPYDFDPDAVKVPYHHANVDCDEVIFYAEGDFMSRAGSGIGPGSISLHPSGFIHGPQPGSRERAAKASRTEELAVMIDTFGPLGLTPLARDVSDPDYPLSWAQTGE